MRRAWLWLGLALVVSLYGGYQGWATRRITQPPGILAPADPVQTPVGSNPPHFRMHDADIVAVARFAMEARVLGLERYRLDAMAKLAPIDFAFGWGPMSDSKVLSRISVTQGNRFYFWTTEEFPIPRRDIETHSANMHLIPGSDAIERRIKAARVGQLVSIGGYLVDVKADSGWVINSSLTREDTGSGACEVIWVESFD